jgi:hypothetical protein
MRLRRVVLRGVLLVIRNVPTPFTSDGNSDLPIWSPDGRLVHASIRNGRRDLLVKAATGTGDVANGLAI